MLAAVALQRRNHVYILVWFIKTHNAHSCQQLTRARYGHAFTHTHIFSHTRPGTCGDGPSYLFELAPDLFKNNYLVWCLKKLICTEKNICDLKKTQPFWLTFTVKSTGFVLFVLRGYHTELVCVATLSRVVKQQRYSYTLFHWVHFSYFVLSCIVFTLKSFSDDAGLL